MTDAVESAGEDMEQEMADELVGGERHDLLPLGIVAAVVFVARGDPSLVEGDEAPVRDGDAMGIARQIGEHGPRPGEWRLGVDDPAGLPGRGETRGEARSIALLRREVSSLASGMRHPPSAFW